MRSHLSGGIEIVDYANDASRVEEAADITQAIGEAAWSERFQRPGAEIDYLFGSAQGRQAFLETATSIREENVYRKRKGYGGAIGATATEYGSGTILVARLPEIWGDTIEQSVGYIIVRNNVSGSLFRRGWKIFNGQRPYAWIQSENVLPEFQGRGIGLQLINQAIAYFDPRQRMTSYVLGENQASMGFYQNLGFLKSAAEPTIKEEFFGPGTPAAEQWRLEASSVGGVSRLIAARYGDRLPKVKPVPRKKVPKEA